MLDDCCVEAALAILTHCYQNQHIILNLPTVASSIQSHRATPSSVSAHHRTDEDLINRSLLDSLDAEADAEPVSSSDSEAAGTKTFGSSSSMSSPESQELIYRFPAQSQPHPRPESPNSHLIHHLSTHNDQYIPTSHQTMYNSSQPSLDFSAPPNDGDTQPQQQHVPSDGFDIYTNSPTFRNYFTNRYRQPMAPANSSSFANEAAGPFTQPFNITAAEVFGTHQPMSPPSQQQTQPGDGIQSVRGFEYPTQTPGSGSNGLKSNSKPIFANLDPFGSSVGGSALLQSHQVAKSSLPQPPQSQSQQQPAYHTPAQNSNQSFMNGLLHTQSQTPYGPHVPSTASGTGTSGPGLPHTSGISVNASQEEISTIFVVGFPEDMQVC